MKPEESGAYCTEFASVTIDGSNDQPSQHIVAGNLDFLACQDLDDFQQNHLSSVMDGDQSCNLAGGNDSRCFVERATAEIIQDDSLMTRTGFFTERIYSNIGLIHTNLEAAYSLSVWRNCLPKNLLLALKYPAATKKQTLLVGVRKSTIEF